MYRKYGQVNKYGIKYFLSVLRPNVFHSTFQLPEL